MEECVADLAAGGREQATIHSASPHTEWMRGVASCRWSAEMSGMSSRYPGAVLCQSGEGAATLCLDTRCCAVVASSPVCAKECLADRRRINSLNNSVLSFLLCQSIAGGMRSHFSSTYFSEDPSVYHDESEHGVGRESVSTSGIMAQINEKGDPIQPDDIPALHSYDTTTDRATDMTASSTIRAVRNSKSSRVQDPSTVQANVTRLARKRVCCGLGRPKSRSQEAKMIQAALAASILEVERRRNSLKTRKD